MGFYPYELQGGGNFTLATGELDATANGAAVDLGGRTPVRAYLVVTAAAGTTPTLNVKIQDSPDGVTWFDVETFTEATEISSQGIDVGACGDLVRAVSTLAGTDPVFTFDVVVVAR